MIEKNWKNYNWTEEKKNRFLFVNNKILEACEKGRIEARTRHDELMARIDAGDPYLSDFEIEICIQPYQDTSGLPKEAEDTMIDFCEDSQIDFHFSSSYHPPADSHGHMNIYLDKNWNWNNEYFCGAFDNEYICYATHVLLDNGWSFNDIMKINQIWVDVQVFLQNQEEF